MKWHKKRTKRGLMIFGFNHSKKYKAYKTYRFKSKSGITYKVRSKYFNKGHFDLLSWYRNH